MANNEATNSLLYKGSGRLKTTRTVTRLMVMRTSTRQEMMTPSMIRLATVQ